MLLKKILAMERKYHEQRRDKTVLPLWCNTAIAFEKQKRLCIFAVIRYNQVTKRIKCRWSL
jgi:hypothetical protein